MADAARHRITIFDVDRTLTRRPTYSAFLLGAMIRTAPWRLALLPALGPVAAGYALGRVPRKRMKQAMHQLALGSQMDRCRATRLADPFAAQVHADGLFAGARAAIAQQQRDGRTVMLATAAPDLYILPLARRLGIDLVIASRASWNGDTLTPAITGENCYGPDKLAMIVDRLAAEGIDRARAHVRFYSDHLSDLPTFEWADEPFIVNPSSRLRAIAERRGWPVLEWTK